jgi:hypothetical protein
MTEKKLSAADHFRALFGAVPSPFRPHFTRTANLAREFIAVEPEKRDPLASRDEPVRFVLNGKGDVAMEMCLELRVVAVSKSEKTRRPLGELLLERATLRIGGKVVDSYDKEYAKIYDFFFRTNDERALYAESASASKEFDEIAGPDREEVLYIPLLFAACRYERSGVPSAALDEDIVIELELGEAEGIRVSGSRLIVDYAYLDTPERAFFESSPLLYDVECVQTNAFDLPEGSTEMNARLNLSGAVKCLFWTFTNWREGEEALESASLSVEGATRFDAMPAKWWRWLNHRSFINSPPALSNAYAMPFVSRPCDPSDVAGRTVFAGLGRVDVKLELSAPAPKDAEVLFYALSTNLLGVRDGRTTLLFGEISADSF